VEAADSDYEFDRVEGIKPDPKPLSGARVTAIGVCMPRGPMAGFSCENDYCVPGVFKYSITAKPKRAASDQAGSDYRERLVERARSSQGALQRSLQREAGRRLGRGERLRAERRLPLVSSRSRNASSAGSRCSTCALLMLSVREPAHVK